MSVFGPCKLTFGPLHLLLTANASNDDCVCCDCPGRPGVAAGAARHFFGSAAVAGAAVEVLVELLWLFLCVVLVLVDFAGLADAVVSLVVTAVGLDASGAFVAGVAGAAVVAGAEVAGAAGVAPWAKAVAANAVAIRAVNSLVIEILVSG